jgi:pilus assembly protein Flp/PilA
MIHNVKAILADDNGQGLAEYGLILSLVSIASIVALTALGAKLTPLFNSITAAL